MKAYKAVGKFYEDVETLSRMFNIKVHPALKPVSYGSAEDGKAADS